MQYFRMMECSRSAMPKLVAAGHVWLSRSSETEELKLLFDLI